MKYYLYLHCCNSKYKIVQKSDCSCWCFFFQFFGFDIVNFGMQQRRAIFDALVRCTKPSRIWDLYAFICGPSKFSNNNPQVRLLNEYFRLLGKSSSHASMSMIEDQSFQLSNDLWRISSANSNYTTCQSYPFALIVPKCIAYDYEIHPLLCCVFEFLMIFNGIYFNI